MSTAYEAFYYAHNCGRPYARDDEWLRFFGSVAERIVRDIGPSSVLDAGCAMGFLVESLRARGVDATGIDISDYAVEKAHSGVRPHLRVGSITDAFPRRYGLIVCIEVLEHLSPAEADLAIENFCKHTEDVLFSSTPFDYKEVTHLNVRPPDYWAQRFAQHGFFRDVDFDASFLTPWAIRFRRTNDPVWRVVYGYERHLWQLEKEVQARRQLTVEQQQQLAEATRQIESLTERAAEGERAVQSLTAEVSGQRETIDALKAELNDERERSRQLLDEKAEQLRAGGPLSEQLAERMNALLAPVVSKQGALESSLAQLLESRATVESLLSQISENEKTRDALLTQAAENERTIASLVAQVAAKEQALESLRAELDAAKERERNLEAQAAEARANVEKLATEGLESRQTVESLSAALREKERAEQTYKSQVKGAELTLAALSRRLEEVERGNEWLNSVRAEKEAYIAHLHAALADVNSSMAWYVYNRIKYPYLVGLFRLYERVKKPYLGAVYRRLGLTSAQALLPGGVPEEQAQEDADASPAQAEFPVAEVATAPPLAPHTASVDVVVCVHNALADVTRCLDSVVAHTRRPYTLIIVDDGSDAPTRDYLASFADSQRALLLRNEQAKGYTFAANQGLRRSHGEYVVLLNSDTVVTPLWLDRMVACAESDPEVGLVGPLSNAASWQSVPEVSTGADWSENELPDGLTVTDAGKLVARYSGRLFPRIPFLNGFCLMIKREVIERLGYFDEEVFGKGYGEENDYCLRAREEGIGLAVADDAYVYHAQSRSYSHERRRELSRHADAALARKHDQQLIWDGVAWCQTDRVLEGVRARARAMFERRRLVEEGMSLWEGKRVLFILTIASACGGGNVVLDEAEAMRKMGVDARLLNIARNRETFERAYPERTVPVMYAEDESRVAEMTADFDAVVATACDTVYWLRDFPGASRQPLKAYYVQDFEPYFFDPQHPGFQIAWNSYTAFPDLTLFTKTEWNRDEVRRNTGAECAVVGESLNIDLNRPRARRDPEWPVRPLRVAAMIRPSTPRRNPGLTMDVLREFQRARGETVEVVLFGCETDDPAFRSLAEGFAWRNAGMLTRGQVASLLNEVDIFADFSEYQAMGLTALEAMACGAAVIVPRKGGSGGFAVHEQNALVADTTSRQSCLDALGRLSLDKELRKRLQQRALVEVCRYYPERAAFNILKALFPDGRR